MIILKDFFDPCGLALVSDDLGVVYEAHPMSGQPVTRTGAEQ